MKKTCNIFAFLAVLSVSHFALAKAKIESANIEKEQVAKVDLVKVDKSTRKMYLYAGNELVKRYHIALGSNPKGHKQKMGDKRTPEGRYLLDYTKEDSAFYRAMHISYPNEKDIELARSKGLNPGGQIMIHGQKSGKNINPSIAQKLNWTNGCIALKNHEMDEFLALVEPGTEITIQW